MSEIRAYALEEQEIADLQLSEDVGMQPGDIAIFCNREFVGFVESEWHAAVLRALVEQAGGVEVEVEHRAPRVEIGREGAVPVMVKEHAVFVDPISVARKSKAGPALLLPMEGSE